MSEDHKGHGLKKMVAHIRAKLKEQGLTGIDVKTADAFELEEPIDDPEVLAQIEQAEKEKKTIIILGGGEQSPALIVANHIKNKQRAMTLITQAFERQKEERSGPVREAIDNLEKIDPAYGYIGTVYDDLTERYYATFYRHKYESEMKGPDDVPYLPELKRDYGFDTAEEARLEAARERPTLPVLSEDGESFTYPYYDEIIGKVKALRDQQKTKQARRMERFLKGQKK